jgi:hypothetical protein
MKNKACWRKKVFSTGLIIFLMLFIIACTPGNGPQGTNTWEMLASLDHPCSFSDFTPAGESVLYTGNGNSFQEYAFPTTGNPQGVFTDLDDPMDNIEWFVGFAWVGGSLYMVQENTVYNYNFVDGWSKFVTTLTYRHYESQSTADDSGYVYSLATSDHYLLKYDTTNNTYAYITTPSDLTTSEPRAAWDSQTGRVYLTGSWDSGGFYAFNPVDKSFTALAPLPDSIGMGDAFCSDRRGHIFTTNGDGSDTATDVWMYTAATDTWSSFTALPFPHGSNAACTVSADGYLYFGNPEISDFARIKVF